MTDTRSSAVDHPNGFSEYEAIITAGGMGTRMLPFSKVIPKEMFPIITYNGRQCLELKPLVQAIYEQLYGAGIRSFYVVVGWGEAGDRGPFYHRPCLLRGIEKLREGPWIENPSWRLYLEIAGIKTHSLDCDIYNRIHWSR